MHFLSLSRNAPTPPPPPTPSPPSKRLHLVHCGGGSHLSFFLSPPPSLPEPSPPSPLLLATTDILGFLFSSARKQSHTTTKTSIDFLLDFSSYI